MRGPTAGVCVPDGADPVSLRSAFLLRGMSRYLRWHLGKTFRAVRVARDGLPEPAIGRPLIVFGNHPGWWDPVLFLLLAGWLMPERACFGVMDADALEKYGVLKRVGVFGIPHGARGAARFLSVGRHILSQPARALFITPQGGFTDARDRPLRLHPGAAHLARLVSGAVVLPLAVEYLFWNEAKPEALVRFGPPVARMEHDTAAALNERMQEDLASTMDRLADQARSRDAALFTPLLRAGTGVGGIYDVWRRGRAWTAGRRFDPSHEGRER